MPAIYATLCATEGMPAKALRMLIVCGAPRAHEVFGMRRGEMQGNQWYVPAKRVKGRTDHIIPLPDEAMAILRAIEPPNAAPTDFVFAGGAPQTINHPAMRLLLRELGYDYDVHGLRTTFKVLGAGQPEAPARYAGRRTVAGSCDRREGRRDLPHTSLIGHRRILNERWSAFLTSVAYTGPYEVPGLSLVVDNAAVA
jgi:integrase